METHQYGRVSTREATGGDWWIAWLDGDPRKWERGSTEDAAIGRLYRTYWRELGGTEPAKSEASA